MKRNRNDTENNIIQNEVDRPQKNYHNKEYDHAYSQRRRDAKKAEAQKRQRLARQREEDERHRTMTATEMGFRPGRNPFAQQYGNRAPVSQPDLQPPAMPNADAGLPHTQPVPEIHDPDEGDPTSGLLDIASA